MIEIRLLQVLTLSLATSCFASFAWSIARFFRREGPMPARMRLVSALGTICMIAHLGGLMLIRPAEMARLFPAVILFGASLAIFWWALCTTWKTQLAIAFSNESSRLLLQDGPYRYVRHPIYAAYMLTWLAGACAIGAWWAWLPLGVMGAQYLSAIRHEERQFLRGPMRREYQEYQQKTGMLLPNPLKIFVESILTSRY